MLTLNLGALSYVRISKANITKDTLNMKFSFVKLFFDEYAYTSSHSTSPPQIDRSRRKPALVMTTLAVFSQPDFDSLKIPFSYVLIINIL